MRAANISFLTLLLALILAITLLIIVAYAEDELSVRVIVTADEECLKLSGEVKGLGKFELVKIAENKFQAGPFREGEMIIIKAEVKDYRRCILKGYISDHTGPNILPQNSFVWLIDRTITKDTINVEFVVEKRIVKKIYITIMNNNTLCQPIINAEKLSKIGDNVWRTGPWYENDEVLIEAIPPEGCYFYSWIPFIPNDLFYPTSNTLLRLLATKNASIVAILFVKGERPPPSTVMEALPGTVFLQLMTNPFGAGGIIVSINREVVESELLIGLPQMAIIAEPGSLVYLKAMPRGCMKFVGWKGSDYAVKMLTSTDRGGTASFTLRSGYTYVEAVFEPDQECIVATGSIRLMRYHIPWIIGGVAAAAAPSAATLLYVGRKRTKEAALSFKLIQAMRLTTIPAYSSPTADPVATMAYMLANICIDCIALTEPDRTSKIRKRVKEVRRSQTERLKKVVESIINGYFNGIDSELVKEVTVGYNPAYNFDRAVSRLRYLILYHNDPKAALHLYSMLRGVAPPPDPEVMATWLTVLNYAQGTWLQRLITAGRAVEKERDIWLREFERYTATSLEEIRSKEPKSIAILLDRILEAKPQTPIEKALETEERYVKQRTTPIQIEAQMAGEEACPRCTNIIPAEASFCPICGEELKQRAITPKPPLPTKLEQKLVEKEELLPPPQPIKPAEEEKELPPPKPAEEKASEEGARQPQKEDIVEEVKSLLPDSALNWCRSHGIDLRSLIEAAENVRRSRVSREQFYRLAENLLKRTSNTKPAYQDVVEGVHAISSTIHILERLGKPRKPVEEGPQEGGEKVDIAKAVEEERQEKKEEDIYERDGRIKFRPKTIYYFSKHNSWTTPPGLYAHLPSKPWIEVEKIKMHGLGAIIQSAKEGFIIFTRPGSAKRLSVWSRFPSVDRLAGRDRVYADRLLNLYRILGGQDTCFIVTNYALNFVVKRLGIAKDYEPIDLSKKPSRELELLTEAGLDRDRASMLKELQKVCPAFAPMLKELRLKEPGRPLDELAEQAVKNLYSSYMEPEHVDALSRCVGEIVRTGSRALMPYDRELEWLGDLDLVTWVPEDSES